MPLGDVAGELLGNAFRVVARLVLEVFVELLVKGVGYGIIKAFRPRSEPGDGACALVGLAFWAVVAVGAVIIYRQAVAA